MIRKLKHKINTMEINKTKPRIEQPVQTDYPTFTTKHNSMGGMKSPSNLDRIDEVLQQNGRQIV